MPTFKPLQKELLRALENLARANPHEADTVSSYVGEVLVHRGLATHDHGKLVISQAGRISLQEHAKRGISSKP